MTSIAAGRWRLYRSVSARKVPWWFGRPGTKPARAWRSGAKLTDLRVVANKAVLLGYLRKPRRTRRHTGLSSAVVSIRVSKIGALDPCM
jgi:hypothetical protein